MSQPELSTEEAAAVRLQGPGEIVTDELIDSKIADVKYFNPEGTLIMCAITMLNGFVVIGTAACADPRKFNLDVGKRYAFNDARGKLWALEGYLLRQKLWEQQGAELTQPTAEDASEAAASAGQEAA